MNLLSFDRWVDLYVLTTKITTFGLLVAASVLAGAVILRRRRDKS